MGFTCTFAPPLPLHHKEGLCEVKKKKSLQAGKEPPEILPWHLLFVFPPRRDLFPKADPNQQPRHGTFHPGPTSAAPGLK